jgi:hypothetical protein
MPYFTKTLLKHTLYYNILHKRASYLSKLATFTKPILKVLLPNVPYGRAYYTGELLQTKTRNLSLTKEARSRANQRTCPYFISFILFKRWAGYILIERATKPPGGYPACLYNYIYNLYIVTRQFERITIVARQGDTVISILDLYDIARDYGFIDRYL